MEHLKIGFFVWEYPPMTVGGLGTYAEYITRKFVELESDVTVFTLNPGGLPVREIVKGVEVHRPLIANATNVFPLFVTEDLRRWGTNIKFFSDVFIYNILSATKLINELVRKERHHYDIVCVHDWLSSIAGLTIKNEVKMPLVFHVHSAEWGRSGDTGSTVVSHLERASAEASDKIITVSNLMRGDLINHGWQENKINVVWNGVDIERYNPERFSEEDIRELRGSYKIEEDEQMLLFVGRLTKIKGINNLIRAMPEILEEFPKARLVILGKGEEQRNVMDLASQLGIARHVAYRFEFVPEKERILHYAASDLGIFPSTYEPFGIVSLEAMSMEKPIVVGARGIVGFVEQVTPSGPEQDGVHVNGHDPSDIAWGVKEVLRDRERARVWGKNGRRKVLRYFTWEKVAKRTLEIYRGLVQR